MNKGWTFEELLDSTQYGKLYVILHVADNGDAIVSRLRRNKKQLVAEKLRQKVNFKIPVIPKQIYFIDRDGFVSIFDDKPEYWSKR